MEPLLTWIRLAAPDDRSDETLLAAFRADHDEQAFAEIVRRHGPVVWGTCRRMLPDATDAEDAFQAAFLVLVRKGYRTTAPLGPWLHRVAVLTARGVRRRNARRLIRRRELPDDVASPPVPDPLELDGLLVRMPEKYRAALVLCYLEGLTEREAADRVGCPVGTLSARVSRGLEWLRSRSPADPRAVLAAAAAVVPAEMVAAAVRTAVVVQAAGMVPATASQIASEVSRSMLLTKLRIALLAAPTALTLAGIGVAALARPGDAPVPPVPVARTADPPTKQPAPPEKEELGVIGPKQPGEPAWKGEFRKAYSLAAGQAVKLVPGDPFPDGRIDALNHNFNPDPPAPTPERLAIMNGQLLTVAAKDGRLKIRRIDGGGYGWGEEQTRKGIEKVMRGRKLYDLLEEVTDLRAPLVDADADLLATQIYADVVVREGATLEQIAKSLLPELRDKFKLRAAVTAIQEEREVIVARGKFAHKARPGQLNCMVDIAPADLPDDHKVEGDHPPYGQIGGGHALMFRRIGESVGRPVVDETAQDAWKYEWNKDDAAKSTGYLGCRWPKKTRYDTRPMDASADRDAVLSTSPPRPGSRSPPRSGRCGCCR